MRVNEYSRWNSEKTKKKKMRDCDEGGYPCLNMSTFCGDEQQRQPQDKTQHTASVM
jgi:hypothetical protein